MERVSTGRNRAVAAANQELVATYWAIGRDILARQSEEGWGTKVVSRLSADIGSEFPEAKGFSPRNFRYMRTFAAAWDSEAIGQAPLAQLPWYHHIALLQHLENEASRLWYAAAAIENGWSRKVLVHQINTRFYERSGKATTNFKATCRRRTLTWPNS
ncbi:DUF1016 N-terminal domain-containing protein [Arthrobacter terrae]|uniref:DUF1016 N-terminal domain-containing protein n=1 Tax=Arthrobacter terrae TaxID=2935737 RepID=UPI0028B1293C|nr:DUF1016 N-terminal domain-containing protein [Arthrobacter terrae]